MEKFEYKVLTISVPYLKRESFQIDLHEKFNNWGNEGWELIKMEPITSGIRATTNEFMVVFKRQKNNR